ncbi:hypothetical protein VTL71DRAFT_13462 [Oculimacula yallundae]|uniref:t-SNARE coiled-coil homology domain-containing protein n=1 Tax=Oculimacula yallundae TaxID=86028 RepID=A0ABR4CKE1_9HELO
MCFGVPHRPTTSGTKPPKTRQSSQTSTSTRIHCPFQATYSQKYPSSPLPLHLISSKTKHTSSKHGGSQSPTTSLGIIPMYASSSLPWSQHQSDPWIQTAQMAGGWSSTATQAPIQQTSISQTQKQDPSFIAWQVAKDEALAQQIASQRASQQAAAEKQEAQEFWDKVDAKLVFGERLRTRFNTLPSTTKDAEAKWEEKEKRVKDDEKSRRLEEEFQRLKKDEDDRNMTAKFQSMLDSIKDPVMGKISDLDKLIRDKDRSAEITDARRAGQSEGVREERERNRTERGSESRSRHRHRSRSSSLNRSRSRSRHRSTKGRQYGGSPTYGIGYDDGYSNGYGNSMINPANYHYQMAAPFSSLNSPQLQDHANQPLIQPAPNSNAYQYNQAVPSTHTGNHYSKNLSTSQFNSTARGISSKLDRLEQGQHEIYNGLGYLDTKLNSMEERSAGRFQDLNDTLKDLNYSASSPPRRPWSPMGYRTPNHRPHS